MNGIQFSNTWLYGGTLGNLFLAFFWLTNQDNLGVLSLIVIGAVITVSPTFYEMFKIN